MREEDRVAPPITNQNFLDFVLRVAIGFCVCFAIGANASWAVEVIEVPAVVAEGSPWNLSIYWIDNERVTFVGAPTEKVGSSRRLEFDLPRRQLIDKGAAETICFDGGFMRYTSILPGSEKLPLSKRQIQVFYGPYGHEVRQEQKPRPSKPDPIRTWNCLFEDEADPLPSWVQTEIKDRGRYVKRLRPEHGFVEIVRNPNLKVFAHYPTAIYPEGRGPDGRIPLGAFENGDIRLGWEYIPFKGAYWLKEDVHVVPLLDGISRSWWLYPNGRVEQALHYDARRALRGDVNWERHATFPVQNGYLIVHSRTLRPGLFGDRKAGLYRFDPNGEHGQLVRGDIGPYAVSPDGCRIAYGNDQRFPDSFVPTYLLQIINVCTTN